MIRLSKRLAALALWLVWGSAAARALTYTVGSDGACTHSTLATAALAAALNDGPDEIRLARNLAFTNQHLHLTNWDPASAGVLTIAGGFDSCADTTPSGRTPVDGRAGDSIFWIDTSGDSASVIILRRLELSGAGERGILVEGESDLEIDDCWIHANGGGGLEVLDGAIVEIDSSTILSNHDTLDDGSGLRCKLGGIVSAARFLNNKTSALGGGIHADGCVISLLDLSELRQNEAFQGGGIYATGDTLLQALGGTFGIDLELNDAADDGGGVYATGTNTLVRLEGSNVRENIAGSEGGGLFATGGAQIVMDRPAGTCGGRRRCSILDGNRLAPTSLAGDGVAGSATSGGEIFLFQTHVEGNGSLAIGGSTLRAAGAGARLRLEGISFWDQVVARLVEVGSGGIATLAFVSASDNRSVAGAVTSPLVVQAGGAASLFSSAFHPSAAIFLDAGVTLDAVDCVLVSDLAHLPAGSTRSIAADPQFANPTAGDFHLAPGSPAVDYCTSSLYAPAHGDGEGETRGFDLASNPDGAPGPTGGRFDLGFDEVRPLFADGFESGNTGAWSSTTG